MMPLIDDDKKDWRRPSEMSESEMDERFGFDRNKDGAVDFRDLPKGEDEEVHWDSEVPDDRSNLRKLHRLKAEDVLAERKRRREETENLRTIREEERFQKEQNKSGLRKFAEAGIASAGAAMHDTVDAPPYGRTIQQPRTYRRMPRPATPSAGDMSQRFNNVRDGTNAFGSRIMGTSGSPTLLGSSGSNVDSFASGLLPKQRVDSPRPQHAAPVASVPRVDPVASFARSALVGNMRPRPAPQPAYRAPAPAPRQHMNIQAFNSKMLSGGTKGKKIKGIRMF